MTGEQPSLFDGDPVRDRDVGVDASTRLAITERLDETMFVEAGAGSGKTKSLVDRIVALVTVADVPMREIVAVTFTEKAAVGAARSHPPRARAGRGRLRARTIGACPMRSGRAARLDELDGAAVSTLHAFAQRLLVEHPIEAGLPPRVEVLDDIASQVAFDERWTRFVDELLDDPALERSLLLALNADTTLPTLRTIALACNANWDLVEERMGPEPEPPDLGVERVASEIAGVCAWSGQCRDADDKLADGLARIHDWSEQLRHAPDEYEQLRLLHAGLPKVHARERAGRTTGRATSTRYAPRSPTLRKLVAEARTRGRRRCGSAPHLGGRRVHDG